MERRNLWQRRGREWMTEPTPGQLKPDLLACALLILEDACPPEKRMNLCRHEDGELYGTESVCARCWRHYLFYVANGRRRNPYHAA